MKHLIIILVVMISSLTGCFERTYNATRLICLDRDVVVHGHTLWSTSGDVYSYRYEGIVKSVKKVDCTLERLSSKKPFKYYEKFKKVTPTTNIGKNIK